MSSCNPQPLWYDADEGSQGETIGSWPAERERTNYPGPEQPKIGMPPLHNSGDREQASLAIVTCAWGLMIHSPADLQGATMSGLFVYLLLDLLWHAFEEEGKRESRIKGPATRSVNSSIASLLNP